MSRVEGGRNAVGAVVVMMGAGVLMMDAGVVMMVRAYVCSF